MIEKLIPRYLNKDDDTRLIKSIEMTDALNVRVSSEEDGDGGVIKNAFGNSGVPFRSGNNWQGLPHALPAPINKVVGSVSDLKNGVIIYFVYNSNGNHSIYRFTTSQNDVELVYRDSVLAFQSDSFVKGDVINNLHNEVLLYFTDGITSPKKINVSRAIIGGYSEVITNGTDEQKLEFITLAKKPPLDPPTYEFFTDAKIDDNNIYEDNFQFAYQYVYLDGEYSALSKYTDLVIADNQYLDGFIDDAQRNESNAIRVYVETSTADVKTIRVLGRRGNTGPWFIAGEISNPVLVSSATLYIEFRNNELYQFISQDEANKIFDAVPFTAQSQTISGSRLFLGNYTEGHPNVRVGSSLLANYEATPEVYNIPIFLDSATINSSINKKINVDVSSIPSGGVSADSIIVINYSFTLGVFELSVSGLFFRYVMLNQNLVKVQGDAFVGGNPDSLLTKCEPVSIYENIFVPAGTSRNDIISIIELGLQKTYVIELSNPITEEYATILNRPTLLMPNGQGFRADVGFGFFSGLGSFDLISQGLLGNTLSMLLNVNELALSLLAICPASGSFNLKPVIGELIEIDSFEFFPTSLTIPSPIAYVGDNNLYLNSSGFGSAFRQAQSSSKNEAENIESSSFLSDYSIGEKAFKSGASHDLGIVLYDDRGRSSGVQKLGSAYIQDLYERSNKGSASVIMRLAGEAPYWASGWAPVYVKSGNKYKFLQYSVSNAFIGGNQSAPIQISGYNGSIIYLSMRSLEGKDNSYREGDGANISYEYVDGDRLRVISYIDPSVNTITVSSINGSVNIGDKFTAFAVPPTEFTVTEINVLGGVGTISGIVNGPMGGSALMINLINSSTILYSAVSVAPGTVYPDIPTFSVVGYKFFVEDLDTNPILNPATESTIFNTTGWFLILKNTKANGFDVSSIVQQNNFWQNQCLVEIYNKKALTIQEVYYEIGESYPIVDGTYIGSRTSSPSTSVRCMNLSPLIFYSPIILYVGDIVSDGTNSFLVNNVIEQQNIVSGVTYDYVVQATRQQGSFTLNTDFSVSVQNAGDAVVQITQGDIYHRIRKLKYGHKSQENNAFVAFIEANNVSDFYSSTNTSIGRPFAVIPDAKTVYRTGSVTYSDPFIIDVTRLGLSSFNPSLAPFYDLNYIHGSIRYMVNRDESVIFLQDKKCGLFPVGRNLVEYVSGQQGITVSTDVVGTPTYYVGDFGVGNNPESVAVEGGRIYFADIRNGKVMRISQDGLTAISETKMDSFFKENFRDIVQFASVKRVVGGVDDEAGEYIISTPTIETSTITVTNGATTYTYQLQSSYSSIIWNITTAIWNTTTQTWAGIVLSGITYDSDLLSTFSTEVRTFDDVCDQFQDSVNAMVFLDLLTGGHPAIVGSEFQGTGQVIYGVATNSTFDFFLSIVLDLSSGVFAFLNDCGSFNASQTSSVVTATGFTVGYDTQDRVWNTRYSYSPERIASLDDTLYTFKAGAMFVHDDTSNRSTYYGVAGSTIVEVISNNNPSMVKSYESLSLEGTDAWATVITNTDQSTSILSGDFSEREREFFAYVPRDTSANVGTTTITSLSGSSEVFVLGNVATSGVSGSTITFTTPVGDVPFPIGGILYKVSGDTLVTLGVTVTAISGDKQITASGAIAGVSDGNTIVVLANAGVEGDQLRDYYARINLTNTDTSEIELYAVNAVFAQSNLHNQQGQ